MNKCKDCQYFDKNYNNEYCSEMYGDCNNEEKFIYDTPRKNEKETDKLFYTDYEDYSAWIKVGQDFGCIHFKSKEKKDE